MSELCLLKHLIREVHDYSGLHCVPYMCVQQSVSGCHPTRIGRPLQRRYSSLSPLVPPSGSVLHYWWTALLGTMGEESRSSGTQPLCMQPFFPHLYLARSTKPAFQSRFRPQYQLQGNDKMTAFASVARSLSLPRPWLWELLASAVCSKRLCSQNGASTGQHLEGRPRGLCPRLNCPIPTGKAVRYSLPLHSTSD